MGMLEHDVEMCQKIKGAADRNCDVSSPFDGHGDGNVACKQTFNPGTI